MLLHRTLFIRITVMNILSLNLSNTVPPEVEVTATLTRVVMGNSTNLTCTVTRSNPMGYTYRWVHNDSITPLNETSNMLNVSILAESDVGVYRCEVTNSAGLSGSNTTTIELGGEYLYCIVPTFTRPTVADWLLL